MTTKTEVAQWMIAQIKEHRLVYQEHIVHEVEQKFGDEWVDWSEGGNRIIDKTVLAEFRRLRPVSVEWSGAEKAWSFA